MIRLALALLLALALFSGLFVYMNTANPAMVDASGAGLTPGLPFSLADGASPGAEVEDRGPAEPELFAGPEFAGLRELMDAGDHASAKEGLVALLASSERDGEACLLASEACRELGQLEEAEDYGLKATRLLPEVGRAHYVYAQALAAKMLGGESQMAAMLLLPKWKEELALAIELEPAHIEARVEQLVFYTYMPSLIGGDLERAAELCTELEDYDPARGKLWMAVVHQNMEEFERAAQLCEEGMRSFPENGMFACTLGSIYAEQERFDEADTSFEMAKQTGLGEEAYYRALIAQATMHVDHELDREKAVALMDAYLADHPDLPLMTPNSMVFFKKGQALQQLGRTDEARTAYEACLEVEPRYEEAAAALEELPESGG